MTEAVPFASPELSEIAPERLVGNLARAYSELRGEPWGAPQDLPAVARDMIEFNGGPLRCLA